MTYNVFGGTLNPAQSNRRRISTSGFAYMATETAVFAIRSAKPCFSWASCFMAHGVYLFLFYSCD